MSNDTYFENLGTPNTIWAISSIHGEARKIFNIHSQLYPNIRPGDRIIYLGNYTGFGNQSKETIDEILYFRKKVISIPGIRATDITYLRGSQEEMWQKLLTLPYARDPHDTLLWMMGNGIGNTLKSYGLCPQEGLRSAREGTMYLIKWTNKVRATIRANKGHSDFNSQLKRAAYTTTQNGNYQTLLVNAGIDVSKPLEKQGDNFWWSGQSFKSITSAYKPFTKVIRGFDPEHEGIHLNCVTATIDGGSGFGGSLACAMMAPDGNMMEIVEA